MAPHHRIKPFSSQKPRLPQIMPDTHWSPSEYSTSVCSCLVSILRLAPTLLRDYAPESWVCTVRHLHPSSTSLMIYADLSRCEFPYHDDQYADFLQDAISPLCHTNTLLATIQAIVKLRSSAGLGRSTSYFRALQLPSRLRRTMRPVSTALVYR